LKICNKVRQSDRIKRTLPRVRLTSARSGYDNQSAPTGSIRSK